jgi:Holliday junction resolvase RusA-like endonuclease
MITLTIPGPPCGKQRARVTRQGHAYTPAKTVNAETLIREIFASTYPGHVPSVEPVVLSVTAYFPIPKSAPKKFRAIMEGERTWYPKRIDADNIYKLVADALNGLAYVDDGQIASGHVLKYYSPRPRVEIEVEELI